MPWDIHNWIEDINFLKTSYPHCPEGCQVHRGFYKAYEDIQEQVKDSVEKYLKEYKDAKI